MADVLVRGVRPDTLAALKSEASQSGRSVQAVIRAILDEHTNVDQGAAERAWQRARELRASLPPQPLDSTQIIREGRDTDWGRLR